MFLTTKSIGLFLLFGYVSLSTCSITDDDYLLLDAEPSSHIIHKRQAQQQYAGPTASNQEPPAEYLEFLQSLRTQQQQQQRAPSRAVQQLVATPQQPTRQQYYQPTSNSAFNLHQTRLNTALNPSNYEQDSESDAVTAANDAALQRQAALNAQQAAQSFRQSYQSRGPHSQVRYSAGQGSVNKEAQPAYTAEVEQTYEPTPSPQVYQPTPTPQVYRPAPTQQAYQPKQQQQVYDAAQQNAAIQALYQQQYQQVQQTPPSLQSYQDQANIAEQAAIAFQQALQQQSKPGAQGQRPRLSAPQYILEQQHSYVVPNTKQEASVPAEEYNLAALQQAYQQIETANQKQVAQIQRQPQRQPQRLVATPAPPSYSQDESGHNIGDGDGFESLKQAGVPATRKQPTSHRSQVIRQRPQPQIIHQQQYEQPEPVQAVQPQRIQSQRVLPQRVQQQQSVTLEPTYKQTTVQYQEPEIQTYQQILPTPIPEAPKRQRIQAPVQSVVPTVQIPRAKPQQYYTSESKAPLVQAATIPSFSQNSQLPNKVGNIDLNLLRSLYAAAESLAITQKGEIAPISEDDLIKALLAQGRREQQAADIIQTAAKAAPSPPPEDKEVVRIPTPKNQRPITQEELQALIDAGYDVRPVGEPKPYDANQNVDPIKQQYLRQAQFLEQQLALKNVRANQHKRGVSQSRRTRGGPSSKTSNTEEN